MYKEKLGFIINGSISVSRHDNGQWSTYKHLEAGLAKFHNMIIVIEAFTRQSNVLKLVKLSIRKPMFQYNECTSINY